MEKGDADYLQLGDYNAICDQCGQKFKASELRKQWDNLRCCFRCWDYRHPQELVRPIVDPKPVPWSRPVPAPIFTQVGYQVSRALNGAPMNYQSED